MFYAKTIFNSLACHAYYSYVRTYYYYLDLRIQPMNIIPYEWLSMNRWSFVMTASYRLASSLL